MAWGTRGALTAKAVQGAKSRKGEYLLADGGGLFLRVRENGSRTWQLVFTFAGKRRKLALGNADDISLVDARAAAELARVSVAAGVDPAIRREAAKIEADGAVRAVIAAEARRKAEDATFSEMFEAWLADGVARKDGNAEIRRAFTKDVLTTLADAPVRETTEHDLRLVLREIIRRGALRMASRVYQDLVQLFDWAQKRQPWRKLMTDGNPMTLIEFSKLIDPNIDPNAERTRVLAPAEIRELHGIFVRMTETYGDAAPGSKYKVARPLQPTSQLALWISLSTACRMGELLMAQWRHVDIERAVWFIPKEHAKGPVGKKQDQHVYLSAFALRQFKALQAITGDSQWCFPARNKEDTHVDVKSVSKQIGDRQERFKNRKPLKNRPHDNTLVLCDGVTGDWTPHDLRRTAATTMQALGVPLDVIDRCQNHVLAGGRVRRAYLHHDYADEKRDAWRRLGGRLEMILAEQN